MDPNKIELESVNKRKSTFKLILIQEAANLNLVDLKKVKGLIPSNLYLLSFI